MLEILGPGFRVCAFEFGVSSLGLSSEFRVWGFECGFKGFRVRVWGLGFGVDHKGVDEAQDLGVQV